MSTTSNDVPLNPQYLLEALRAASSASQDLVKQATSQLQQWERAPGYWVMLQDVFLDRTLPLELRWIAIITLKQGVIQYWRKNAINQIPKPDKQTIRNRLITASIEEPASQLAAQNAVIIAKVARLEYPLEWPKIFSDLTHIIRRAVSGEAQGTDTTLQLTRALSILLSVVKELASGRLTRTKSNLQAVAPEILKLLGDVYIQHVQIWQGFVDKRPPPGGTVEIMTISVTALKIMRRLMVSGYEFPNRAAEVSQLWQIMQEHVWSFVRAEEELPLPEDVHNLLKKHATNTGKLFLDLSQSHPAAFALLPNTLDLLRRYWDVVVSHGDVLASQSKITMNAINGLENSEILEDDDEVERRRFREKIALQGMNLLRECIKMVYHPTSTFRYRHKEEKEEIGIATNMFKTQLFVPQAVTHYMEVLVTRYFVLRPSDLEGWEQDPEGWNEEWENNVESHEFMIRPCAEKLFNDLMVNHKEVLAEPLMNVFRSIPTIAKDDILIKDAIYTAVGLAANVLHQNLNFDEFITNTLVEEVQIVRPGYNILRRRIAIMIGQWISVRISVATRPVVYGMMRHLLNREDRLNDLVVRLTAAHNLNRCVDEWDFRIEAFLPYVDDIFNRLMLLIEEVHSTESKMGILNVVGVIVDRLEHRVTAYADRIVSILPPLWEQTGEEHLFKQSILAIFTKLVTAMKEQSAQYHHMIIPLIKFSVEPGSKMQVYLFEDALELWEATIRCTAAPASQELLDLFPYLLPALQLGSQTLRHILDLIESYVLLAPREIIENHRIELFTNFAELLGALKPETAGIVTNIVDILIRGAKEIGGDQALNIVGVELVRSEFLIKIFETLRESFDANMTTGPNRKYPPPAVMVTDYFSLLGRIVVSNVGWFMEIVKMIAERAGQSVDDIMDWLVSEWFTHVRDTLSMPGAEDARLTRIGLKFSNMGHPRQRKLNCFALTMLLETNQRWILTRLQDLMTVWTDVITELREDGAVNDSLVYWNNDAYTEEPTSPQAGRYNDLVRSDVVNSIDVAQFIKHHLEKAQNENGGPDAFREAWVVNVDRDVLEQFAKLGLV